MNYLNADILLLFIAINIIFYSISFVYFLTKKQEPEEKEQKKQEQKIDLTNTQSKVIYDTITHLTPDKEVSIYFKEVRDKEMKCFFTLDNIKQIIEQRETISAQNGDFIDRIILITTFNEESKDLYVKLNDSKKHYKFHKVDINIFKYSDNFGVNEFPFEDFEVNTFSKIEDNKLLFEFVRCIKEGKII